MWNPYLKWNIVLLRVWCAESGCKNYSQFKGSTFYHNKTTYFIGFYVIYLQRVSSSGRKIMLFQINKTQINKNHGMNLHFKLMCTWMCVRCTKDYRTIIPSKQGWWVHYNTVWQVTLYAGTSRTYCYYDTSTPNLPANSVFKEENMTTLESFLYFSYIWLTFSLCYQ